MQGCPNVLPTAENLWYKKIIHDPICQVCKRQAESILHALLKCKVVRKVWKLAPFAGKILNLVEQPMMCVMEDMVESLKRTEMELLIAILLGCLACQKRIHFLGKTGGSLDYCSEGKSHYRVLREV